MKFIALLPVLVLCCCSSSRQPKQKTQADIDTMLRNLSAFSDAEGPLLNMNDTFKKWLPVWDTIMINDGRYRMEGSSVYFDNTKEQNKLDSVNLGLVTFFLDKYGFPTRNQSGSIGLITITNVMQHAPIATQEKYYPMWVDAYKNNKLLGAELALLEDRINMYRHRKQYYATQRIVYDDGEDYLYPVVNPDSIDAWRKQMDMDHTIEEQYKDLYKRKWDIDQYKKDLPDLIKKFKVTDTPGIRFIK